jgi:hypothetical protein
MDRAQLRCLGKQSGFVQRACPEPLQREFQFPPPADPRKAKVANDGHAALQACGADFFVAMFDWHRALRRCPPAEIAAMVVSHR